MMKNSYDHQAHASVNNNEAINTNHKETTALAKKDQVGHLTLKAQWGRKPIDVQCKLKWRSRSSSWTGEKRPRRSCTGSGDWITVNHDQQLADMGLESWAISMRSFHRRPSCETGTLTVLLAVSSCFANWKTKSASRLGLSHPSRPYVLLYCLAQSSLSF